MRLFLLWICVGLLAGCSSDSKNLANAVGQVGDIYMIMDSTQMKGPVGDVLDSLFSNEMPGLPRKEPIFRIRWIDVRKFNYVLKGRRNLVFVMTLDRRTEGANILRKSFTPESINKIKSDPTDFYTARSDVFARNQAVVYLYGTDEATLIKNLRDRSDPIIQFFNNKEKERLTASLFKTGQVTGITEILNKEFKCGMKIPYGFKLAYKKPDFVWIRQINPRDTKDIIIARKPYGSQEDFKKENLIRFRDDIGRQYLFDAEENGTYLMTETKPYIPVTADTVNFNGHFAVSLRGLFRSNDLLVGGPFSGYALVDEATQQFYYIEGFTISPTRDQREIMRELEVILYTFRTSAELEAK